MHGARRQDFRREHAIDSEKLKLHGITAAIGSRVDESQRARKLATVIAGRLGNKERPSMHARGSFLGLTISKRAFAKGRLIPRGFRKVLADSPRLSTTTSPVFIVSSGRSGTAMLHKLLSAVDGVEMHHEYMVHIVQPLAVKRYLGWVASAEAVSVLRGVHGAAVHYSEKPVWGDSSNKLSWLIDELAEALPDAKFVHLVRDGRKVASSYFHKLDAECYDDRSTAILAAHARDPARNPAPPPEKKYWWPQPRPSDDAAEDFKSFDQFERICWHWAEINRVILESLADIAPERKHFARLESLEANPPAAAALFGFLGLPFREAYHAMFARPHNVTRPEDRLLDTRQAARFQRIAGAMLDKLGYAGKPEYVVKY
jgi:hypothetical protein